MHFMPRHLTNKFFLCFLIVLCSLQYSNGQKVADTVPKVKHPYPDPKVAMLSSIIVPGLGQFYNKRWWKVGIIYAGLGTCAYFAVTNQQQYAKYHQLLVNSDKGIPNPDPTTNVYTASDLFTIENYYGRNRDISYIAAAFIYILNIVDANVDAQLHNFDVSDNISFRFKPQFYVDMSGRSNFQPVFCLTKRF
jgi:hypothetical protein